MKMKFQNEIPGENEIEIPVLYFNENENEIPITRPISQYIAAKFHYRQFQSHTHLVCLYIAILLE